MQKFPDNWDLKTKIEFLQRKIILNSIAYYEFDTNFLEDRYYDCLCRQLVQLQEEYGDVNDTQYGYVMYDFDGSTGFDLMYRLNESDKEYLMNMVKFQIKGVGSEAGKKEEKSEYCDLEEEEWRDIKCLGVEYSGYKISNYGRVMNIRTNHILVPQFNKRTGYYYVTLKNNKQYKSIVVHKLVAETFLGERPYKHDINHIDGNKLNNYVGNLEYCTRSENVGHAYKNGLNSMTTSVKIVETGEVFNSINDCARAIGDDHQNIHQCLSPKYRRNTCRGYHFEVVDSSPLSTEPVKIKIRETGEIFNSARECARHVGGSHNYILYSAKNDVEYKGLHFDYYNEENDTLNGIIGNEQKSKDFLYPHQKEALTKMFNGCLLNGGTGSGKSRTGIYYFFQKNGGRIENQEYIPMKDNPPDLYILTTAKKKGDLEWEGELANFLLYPDPKTKETRYGNKIIIDSWQVIKKYADVKGAQFIFDENKISGKGVWAKAFLKIAKNNEWIILSATNGDKWEDYATVFIAHGFFRNRTEFNDEHLVYSKYNRSFPQVTGYHNESRLIRLRDKLLIDMDFDRHTTQIHEDVYCSYDISKYKEVMRKRWDPYKDEPITQASGLCHVLRRIVNTDESRQVKLLELLEDHPKSIIFYNFNYELDILLNLGYAEGTKVAQYNGTQHDKLPVGDRWVYLVQYTAGCEAWNTISTDTIIFFSQNYSYKVLTQASGRIDRLTTPFNDLHYYHLKSRSGIDLAISKALSQKKKFNERKFAGFDK